MKKLSNSEARATGWLAAIALVGFGAGALWGFGAGLLGAGLVMLALGGIDEMRR